MKRRLQAVEPVALQPAQLDQAPDGAGQVFDFRGPFFKTDEAAAYLNYRGTHRLRSLYRFLAMKGIPTARRCRTLLIKKTDLDAAIGARQRKAS